jgi:excinuclease ABC subunit B
MKRFTLHAPFTPTGDQPTAIRKLLDGLERNTHEQVLLGVTGSGKTYTMAKIIEEINQPTLILSHNKTLAAQLYQEFKEFFPENAVSYFVSYYDYYQPEAYVPSSDTYIEKETEINEEIDKLRLAATTNLLTRKDTIIIASVSCIYNIGSPKEYGHFALELQPGPMPVVLRRFLWDRLECPQTSRLFLAIGTRVAMCACQMQMAT